MDWLVISPVGKSGSNEQDLGIAIFWTGYPFDFLDKNIKVQKSKGTCSVLPSELD